MQSEQNLYAQMEDIINFQLKTKRCYSYERNWGSWIFYFIACSTVVTRENLAFGINISGNCHLCRKPREQLTNDFLKIIVASSVDAFKCFYFNDQLVNHIITQSNLYAGQKGQHRVNISFVEINTEVDIIFLTEYQTYHQHAWLQCDHRFGGNAQTQNWWNLMIYPPKR